MTEFERINSPRVDKILAMLATIGKSAKSNKVSEEELESLLSPLTTKLNPKQETQETKVVTTPTPHIAKELEALGSLSTQQLVDRMIACGAELASRRL